MRHLLSYTFALLVPVLLLAGPLVGAQKKPDDKDKDKPEKPAEKYIKTGTMAGKVEAVYEDKKMVRITMTYQIPKLNQSAINGIAQAKQAYAAAIARRDINAANSAAAQLAQHQRNMYTMETKTEPKEINTTDDVLVRAAKPPESFDEKGKVKKLTKKELTEAKGDPKLPGYKAEFGDIQVGSYIQATLVRKKDADGKAPAPPKGKKGKDAEAELTGANLPLASQIFILQDPPMEKK